MGNIPAIIKRSLYPFHFLLPYLFVWWLLSGNRGWAFGVPAALAATALAIWLGIRPWRLRVYYLPSFILFLLHQIVAGAWDVARRTLSFGEPLQPAWHTYELTVEGNRARLLCSAILGLMPGTLASEIENNYLRMHVLDERMDWRGTARKLEWHLGRVLIED